MPLLWQGRGTVRRVGGGEPIDQGGAAHGDWRPEGRQTGHAGNPRKEVIQPQLPLRLPCYDFTPITDPTLDRSLPCGLGPRLQVLPAFVV